MAVLTIGLLAVGVGTMAFLRTTLVASLDSNLETIARTDVMSALFEVDHGGDGLVFTPREGAVPTDNAVSVAIYDSTGELLATAGGDTAKNKPVFPHSYRLDIANTMQGETVPLPGTGTSDFRSRVVVVQVPGTNEFYTQLIALPTAPVTQVVTAFSAIFGILALVTIIVAALMTRWIVTLTFRSLGQVEATAMTIAAGDFGLRMTSVEPTTTEVGRLKTAINAMLGRIDGAISQRDATVRQMRRFIGDASHELRTPLVTVRGYAELYRMGAIQSDQDVAQAMDRIEKEAIRMGVLVEDLLALARLDERRDVVFAPVDLRPVARDAAMDVVAAAPQRIVEFIDTTASRPGPPTDPTPTTTSSTTAGAQRRRPSPLGAVSSRLAKRRRARGEDAGPLEGAEGAEPPSTGDIPQMQVPIVVGDENRVRQVVANLLGNARRFSADDSPIEIRVGSDMAARTGWIEVIDHGEGIPEQIREQIFQRFWRADTSRARETGGSGLGLSIVSSIVDALHGSVTVFDTAGGGATFRVALPLLETPDRGEQASIETQPLERLPD